MSDAPGPEAPKAEAPKPPQPATQGSNTATVWIVLVIVVLVGLFVFLIPVRDNPDNRYFKQTVWDMLVGNKGTQILRR